MALLIMSMENMHNNYCYNILQHSILYTYYGATDRLPRVLNDGEVFSLNFTVILQMDTQAGDVLGFRINALGAGGRIEHLPLLYKPGPTPGSFTPIVIASFTATSDSSPTKPSDVL